MNVALLISGGGTTAQAVIQSAKKGKLKGMVTPAVVIASDPNAGGIQKAKALGVPVEIVQRNAYQTQEQFGSAILIILQKYHVAFISQNGWLPLTPRNVIEAFDRKIMNQHPGPLDPGRPDFGGKGMFGARVTCARILYCMLTREQTPWTEAVTHAVTEEFDQGSLIKIKRLEFSVIHDHVKITTIEQDNDLQVYIKQKTKDVQSVLLPLEHENVIDTLLDFAIGFVHYTQRSAPLIPKEHEELLLQAKGLAIKFFPNG